MQDLGCFKLCKGGAKLKIKVYLNDWFYNAGIIGFLRILYENDNEFVIRKNNYIEFDTEELRNFHKCYFNYFFKKYNNAEALKNKTKKAFDYLESNIEEVGENKEKIKLNIKLIKEEINKQLEKIKNFDKESYDEIEEQCNSLDKATKKKAIIEIKEKIFNCIGNEKINKKLTLNKIRFILSKKYYGQMSFLQINRSNMSYEEQQELMYRDYVSNIVETGFINDIIQNKYEMEQIKEYIENTNKSSITKEIERIYNRIEKNYIAKSKTIEDIQKYLKEKVIQRCSMCENEIGLTTNYSEGHFIPLAISSDNARNFFWNQNVKMPICSICKLILFCIPAGMTTITKTIKENGEYKEKQILSFVNCDTEIDELYKTNINFGNRLRYENKRENPYSELILDIVEQDRKISVWKLENIFVVELEADYEKRYSKIDYFNIKRYMSIFFAKYSEDTLLKIWDYKYRLQIVDYIMKNKDIKYIINDRLREEIKKDENRDGYNSFLATRIRMILNALKKEGKEVEDIKKNDNKLKVVYKLGIQIHEKFKANNQNNKLNSYIYKLLNIIRAQDEKGFMYMIIKLHMATGESVSPIFVEAVQSQGLDFETVGYSFIEGLISDKYEKKEEGKIDG